MVLQCQTPLRYSNSHAGPASRLGMRMPSSTSCSALSYLMTLLLSFWDPTQGCFLLWTIFHHNFSLFSALTAFLPHPLPWLFSFPCNSVACPGLFTSQGGTVALFPFSPHCLAGIRPPSSSFRRLRRVWSWGVTKPELFKQYLKLGGKGYRLEEGRVNAEKWAWWLFNQC